MNLYNEIYDILKEHNFTIFDIDYVLIDGFKVDVVTFLNACNKIEYDNSYGLVCIKTTIFIVLKNGCWLERETYDGSEWFEYKSCPKSISKLNPCSIVDMIELIQIKRY